ncbi:I78 family peptidase inhibitor [Variovorax sp. RA8]|uniref:I78 family peptidase inhibitor n=1 Tax=Variovorax sp. (strain JCM 16519 / RA8) TaxID=662548 RepID=UPI0013166275|nr:I78 family peptidase inhibitor [Variovorax sp. RA8]VTU33633.1 Peptidase inhibitor I78 family protein [Variovorax sp. RA8]
MKSRFLAVFALAAAALLSGCAAPAPAAAPALAPAPTSAPVGAAPAAEPLVQCRADDARFAVGQAATPQLEAAARVRAGAQSVRTLKPDQAVTMEFNGGRLNLVVDARVRVTAVRCG